ncbi:polyphosphate:AMP phosphotransferase [Fontimonas sp. SYSU GA230001]|uniref:polyphosphate:AMP phosphotransferase n=1 Tax=Fontimonas sp. SYSU GA230001 TaxID=3142450 RepID=UPI0032B50584
MFESAELGHKLSKSEYKRIAPGLRADLLDAQYDLLKDSRFPVIVLISGVRGAGKGETVNLLNEWMDPRHIHTHAFDSPTDEERERPYMWRFWRALPPKGRIGILFGSWYTAPIIDRVFKRNRNGDLVRAIEEINRFERMLADEGALILKFWFHLSRKQQEKRLRTLQSDAETSWRVTDRDWDFLKRYDRFYNISEETLRQTSSAHAPWLVIEGSDPEYRAIAVGQALLDAMRKRLQVVERRRPRPQAPPIVHAPDHLNILQRMDLDLKLDKKVYGRRLVKLQRRLAMATRHKRFSGHNVVCVFEGMDAAGKGGAIRRITSALDARLYHTIPVAAPSDEERAQPYLWRFWRHLPRHGRVTIYDRSWYGRVLVERVEGFCSEADWLRAYSEINDFEEQLTRSGTVVAKFWLQISKSEQLRRFRQREKTRFKRFKITPEDWRNREKWEAYQVAAADMIERTSTPQAPWTLVESNDKYHARIKVLETLTDAIESALDAR